jgi:hypothetical protein
VITGVVEPAIIMFEGCFGEPSLQLRHARPVPRLLE